MNKVITKCMCYLLGFMIGLLLCLGNVYAVDTYHVSMAAAAIQMVGENQYIVPVYIRNNQGLMGFKIDLNYDTQNVKIQSVSKGLVTAKGNFSSNVTLEQNNEAVSVLWNATRNITGDGSIMYLGVKVLKPEVETVNIEINYSQPDTFNEQWKDVVLQCDSISFKPQQIVDGSNESKDDMKELTKNKEEIQYQSEAKQSISKSQQNSIISEEQLKGALVRTLKKYKAASISNISEKEEIKFWSDVEDDLQKQEHIRKSQLRKLDLPQIADMVIITDVDFDHYSLQEEPEDKVNIGIFVVAGITVLLVVIIVLCGKRRKNCEKE